jgi:1-acyl-sn-glycerol-3-phosphate acyltransferase
LQRYFAEPYRFVSPYRSTLWCRLLRWYFPFRMLRRMLVDRLEFRGLDRLEESLRQGAGVLLTPNHSRWPDPLVLGALGVRVGKYFYYLTSYHQFKQGRFSAWVTRRLGAYSILREGTDLEAVRTSVQILAGDPRPLVIFPEGTWFRQNDRLGPLQEGVGLIARQAARAAKRPVLVHPVALKYWVLVDPRPALGGRLERLERRLTWQPQDQLGLVERIEKIGSALLAVKEVEFFGHPGHGDLGGRIAQLVGAYVSFVEKRYAVRAAEGLPLKRIRRLRQQLVPRLPGLADRPEEAREMIRLLDDLMFCENLNANDPDYLRERPSLERLTEAVQRLEETISDADEAPVVPTRVVVEVGPAIDVKDFPPLRGAQRTGGDPLVAHLATTLQGMLDRLLQEGPPAGWHCPPRVETSIPSNPRAETRDPTPSDVGSPLSNLGKG